MTRLQFAGVAFVFFCEDGDEGCVLGRRVPAGCCAFFGIVLEVTVV